MGRGSQKPASHWCALVFLCHTHRKQSYVATGQPRAPHKRLFPAHGPSPYALQTSNLNFKPIQTSNLNSNQMITLTPNRSVKLLYRIAT